MASVWEKGASNVVDNLFPSSVNKPADVSMCAIDTAGLIVTVKGEGKTASVRFAWGISVKVVSAEGFFKRNLNSNIDE